jgi:hypothetical protein
VRSTPESQLGVNLGENVIKVVKWGEREDKYDRNTILTNIDGMIVRICEGWSGKWISRWMMRTDEDVEAGTSIVGRHVQNTTRPCPGFHSIAPS